MEYLVTGFKRPGYYDVLYGRGKCDWFVEVVKANSYEEAREMARYNMQQASLSLVTVDDVQLVKDDGLVQSEIFLPNYTDAWWDSPITFFDVETTGFSPETERIVEIGFSTYDIDRKEFIEAESYLINDGKAIPEEATNVHGITNKMIFDAPDFKEAFNDFYPKFIKGRLFMGAHNRGFDISHLLSSMFRHDIKKYIPPTLCTMEMALDNDELKTENNKLGTLVEYFNLDEDNSHRAGDDAKAAGNVFLSMARLPGSFFRQVECNGRDTVKYIDNFSWPKDHLWRD
jgi:DNA polymerase-3 subunit alpha (Gram-positive type)